MGGMIVLDDFETLKRKVETLRRLRDEQVGMAKQLKTRLFKEFGVKTVKQARAKLKREKLKELRLAKKYTSQKKKLEKDFSKELDEV